MCGAASVGSESGGVFPVTIDVFDGMFAGANLASEFMHMPKFR